MKKIIQLAALVFGINILTHGTSFAQKIETGSAALGQCSFDICVGQQVFNIQTGNELVTVVGVQADGKFQLRFTDQRVEGDWNRADLAVNYGCSGDICVGQPVYNITDGNRLVIVVGIQSNGKFLIKFPNRAGIGNNWDRSSLAVNYGCSGDICVGQPVYNIQRGNILLTVVGIQTNGKFLLQFPGSVGNGWDRSDLAVNYGCSGGICVGQQVRNTRVGNRLVTVVGIQTNGKILIQFPAGNVGNNWDPSDLVP